MKTAMQNFPARKTAGRSLSVDVGRCAEDGRRSCHLKVCRSRFVVDSLGLHPAVSLRDWHQAAIKFLFLLKKSLCVIEFELSNRSKLVMVLESVRIANSVNCMFLVRCERMAVAQERKAAGS